MDIVGDSLTEPEWLETPVANAGEFRIWHLIFFGLSGVLSISESFICEIFYFLKLSVFISNFVFQSS